MKPATASFSVPDNTLQAASRFANAHIKHAVGGKVSMRDAYEAFTAFCTRREMPASEIPSIKSFARWAKAMFPVGKTNIVYLEGIELVQPQDLFVEYLEARLTLTTDDHRLPVSCVVNDFAEWFTQQGMVFAPDDVTLARFKIYMSNHCDLIKATRNCYCGVTFSC